MTLSALVLDDVLANPAAVRGRALAARYRDVTGPGGDIYPTISEEVPVGAAVEVHHALDAAFGQVVVHSTLLRLTLATAVPPFWAHTDRWLGSEYSGMLYLNPPEQCSGGTLLVEHETGLRASPTTLEEEGAWRRDANDRSRWRVTMSIPMQFNRLAVIPSNAMHAAGDGFGESVSDGRLVLLTFFSPRRF